MPKTLLIGWIGFAVGLLVGLITIGVVINPLLIGDVGFYISILSGFVFPFSGYVIGQQVPFFVERWKRR